MSEQENKQGLSRRQFLNLSSAAAATIGVAPLIGNPASSFAAATDDDDYYAKLGVEKIINAAGTYTFLTAACMPPKVQRAVAKAALHPVRLKDLQTAAGEYLAKKLRCEGALVSCGASSALTLATAACVASANNIKAEQIPEDIGPLKNEVVVQKAHRYEYDHAMLLCGVHIKEVVTLDDYKKAIGPNTVMTNFFNAVGPEDGAQIDRETWLKVAHDHGVPCHLDAAADMPPISNLWKYTEMGFDLVCFSGGKGIRGPQNAGLLLGKKHLIDLATESNNPNSAAVGRGMKVAKEQIVGMVAAVDWLLEQSDEANHAEYLRQCNVISDAVKDVPTMKSTIFVPPVANHVPHLILSYDASVVGITPKEVQAKLRAQTPSIELNPATGGPSSRGLPTGGHAIVIATWMMQPGDAEIVARSLRAALKKA